MITIVTTLLVTFINISVAITLHAARTILPLLLTYKWRLPLISACCAFVHCSYQCVATFVHILEVISLVTFIILLQFPLRFQLKREFIFWYHRSSEHGATFMNLSVVITVVTIMFPTYQWRLLQLRECCHLMATRSSIQRHPK